MRVCLNDVSSVASVACTRLQVPARLLQSSLKIGKCQATVRSLMQHTSACQIPARPEWHDGVAQRPASPLLLLF